MLGEKLTLKFVVSLLFLSCLSCQYHLNCMSSDHPFDILTRPKLNAFNGSLSKVYTCFSQNILFSVLSFLNI